MADFFSIVTFGKRRRLDILSWGPSCSKPADLCRLGSNFSLGFFFFCWREFSRIICPILENCRQKEWKLIRFLTFHMWTQFSYSFLYPTFNSPALIISVIYYYYFFAVGEEGEDALRQSEMSTNEITALMFWRNGSSDLSVCYEKNKQRAEQL